MNPFKSKSALERCSQGPSAVFLHDPCLIFNGLSRHSESSRMIYSQAFRNEQYSPAVALFSAAGLIRTTAGITDAKAKKRSSARKYYLIASDAYHVLLFLVIDI
uniref:TPR_REGION domain-containing protein n=1 Tax=Heterorhabditis bacteriophora TaxID=37862 RepID=A0A1I7XDL8_HETBA